MKKMITMLVCMCTATVFLSSCVSKRKYVASRVRVSDLANQNLALEQRVKGQQDTINYLHNRLGALGNANENANSQLDKTNDQLNRTAAELNMTKDQVIAQRQRMQQLQTLIDQQHKAAEALRSKIADALVGFTSSELTVAMKNGKVYISMQESLLFPSGSAVVNTKGKDALSKVATVLNGSKDINIDIEGHTDNVPIKTKMYPDNWSLSTARATSIAHVLIDDYHVVPNKLIASGRSEYDPIAVNTTPEGRAQNRRTEIILEPKLDELMTLMSAN
jgi:chemotaxis protein MotB